MSVVGVGLDLCGIDRMKRAIDRHGDRFLRRIYTESERAYCASRARPEESFAVRFAAKEATSKALGAPKGIGWHDVEIVAAVTGVSGPAVALSGVAAQVAANKRVATVLVSLTHELGVAAAVAVAVGVPAP